MFDAHIHLNYGPADTPREFLRKTASAGIFGGNIFCPPPERTLGRPEGDYRWEARLEKVLAFTAETPGFYPFYRFNPTDADVEKQIFTAAERGCRGYKIICEKYFPKDCLRACAAIAETGFPVMFHSGVLDGGRDMICTEFNRPSSFEILFSVRNLRFSLAHIGWPWIDDYMAMVAKSGFTYDPEFANLMYVDLAPGTPGIYREEALRKLYLTGYKVKNRVLWGTDACANDYQVRLPKYWLERDIPIMERIAADADIARLAFSPGTPDLSDIFHLATEVNWKRFAGIEEPVF